MDKIFDNWSCNAVPTWPRASHEPYYTFDKLVLCVEDQLEGGVSTALLVLYHSLGPGRKRTDQCRANIHIILLEYLLKILLKLSATSEMLFNLLDGPLLKSLIGKLFLILPDPVTSPTVSHIAKLFPCASTIKLLKYRFLDVRNVINVLSVFWKFGNLFLKFKLTGWVLNSLLSKYMCLNWFDYTWSWCDPNLELFIFGCLVFNVRRTGYHML